MHAYISQLEQMRLQSFCAVQQHRDNHVDLNGHSSSAAIRVLSAKGNAVFSNLHSLLKCRARPEILAPAGSDHPGRPFLASSASAAVLLQYGHTQSSAGSAGAVIRWDAALKCRSLL